MNNEINSSNLEQYSRQYARTRRLRGIWPNVYRKVKAKAKSRKNNRRKTVITKG